VKSEDAVKMAQQLALKEGLLVSHRHKKNASAIFKKNEKQTSDAIIG
jgi:hypothetical protein